MRGECIIPNPLDLESETSVESDCLEVVHTHCHPQVTLRVVHVDNMFAEVLCVPMAAVFFLHFQSSYMLMALMKEASEDDEQTSINSQCPSLTRSSPLALEISLPVTSESRSTPSKLARSATMRLLSARGDSE